MNTHYPLNSLMNFMQLPQINNCYTYNDENIDVTITLTFLIMIITQLDQCKAQLKKPLKNVTK